jgi:hypothetical protein
MITCAYDICHIYDKNTLATQPISWLSFMSWYQESTTRPQQSLSHATANCRHLNILAKCPKPCYIFSFQNNTKCVINFWKFFKATIHFQILCWAPFTRIDSTSSMLAMLMSFFASNAQVRKPILVDKDHFV